MRRTLPLLLAVVVVLAGGPAWAKASTHRSKRPATLVLHPRWHVVASSGVQAVVVSGRYAFIGQRPTSGTLVDEQTGKRTVLSAPAGCSFTYFGFGEAAALGVP
jgi:hypothetical protein